MTMKKPILSQRHNPREFLLPDSATELTPLSRIRLALEAVQTLNWANSGLISPATQTLQPRMMLTLLTYCYSSGVHGSQQVFEATRDHPMVRYICAHCYPHIEDIRKFRRENRAVVFECLRAFYKLARTREDHASSLQSMGLIPPTAPNPTPESQALHCIELASFTDLMELDE